MYKNYFKTAFRNLWRNRQFTFINIAGLALGIAVFLFIIQYVAFEWSANRFNKNYNELYRVNVQVKDGNTGYYFASGYGPMLKKQVPAIENFVRVADGIGNGVISYAAKTDKDSKTFRQDVIFYVEGSFLDVFSFPLVAGSPSLAEPKTMAISETISRKLFGNIDAIGKTLMVSNQFGNTPYTVKAIYQLPQTSDIKSDVLLSIHTLESAANRDGNDWADPNSTGSGFTNMYLQLKKGTNTVATEKSITDLVRSVSLASKDDKIILQPFSALHLAPSFNYPLQTFGSLILVAMFACVAVLILLIAWINYINLSTAQTLGRAKEVGVRKVLGATRVQLIIQYLTETFLLTLASVIVAVAMVNLLQAPFNLFTGKQLSLAILNTGGFWLAGTAFIVVGSLLAGGYVAFVLTAYKPITTIRGKLPVSIKGFSLRKGLVVFQFTISIVFVIATFILYEQLQYMRTGDLGMKLDELLVVAGPTVASEGQAEKNVSFKNALGQLPFVKKYAASNNVPGRGYNFSSAGITRTAPQKDDEKKSYSMFISDDKFFDTYGISFVQGHTFTQEDAERSWNNVRKVIINEKAAGSLGFKKGENIVGQKILWGEPFEVIGVVKDYHHLSLRETIQPTIYLGSVSYSYFTIKTDTKDIASKLDAIKNIYSKTFPGNPFEYFFADENFDQQYHTELQLGNVFVAAACIAILIACMGLFGLAAFSARQRIKEIGIRKVLGASVVDITALLSKDFIKLVILAIVIASPIASLAMSRWLDAFAYRTEINWWIFPAAGIMAVAIALITVSFLAIRSAVANPVKSLRTE